MTREEAKKILGENATDEQITNLLNAYHTQMGEKDTAIKDLTEKLQSSNSQISELTNFKNELDELKKSQMSEQELFEQQKKELAQQISANRKAGNSIKAKSILVGAGMSSENADELVGKFVREDEKETLDLANLFVNQLNMVKENTTKQVTDKLAGVDLRPQAGNTQSGESNAMTWEKFTKMSLDEQAKFQSEHPKEFEAL